MMCYIYNKMKCRIGRVVMACLGLCLLASCSSRVVVDKQLSESPKIFPDYQNVTIPSQMAPLHSEWKRARRGCRCHFFHRRWKERNGSGG